MFVCPLSVPTIRVLISLSLMLDNKIDDAGASALSSAIVAVHGNLALMVLSLVGGFACAVYSDSRPSYL